MIFSKKLRKTAASVLALVMVFAMSTGAFAYGGTATADGAYYNVSVSYVVDGELPEGAQISIIALEGYAENAEAGDVKVTFDGSTANNVLWIDQQAAAESGTFTFQVDASKVADNGFHIKSGVTGGETMMGYVTVAVQEPEPELSSDASLSAITVNGEAATLTDLAATYALDANAATAKIGYTAAAGATAVITGADNEGNVTLTEGANAITITVTAEDGTTQKVYTLTITNPAASGGDTGSDVVPETVVPDANISVNGGDKDGTDATITGDAFGVTGGKVVKLKPAIKAITELPAGKTIAVNGAEAFYTEYVIGGETVIKFVTLITEAITNESIKYIDGTPQKLIFGDADGSGGAPNIFDATEVLGIIADANKADSVRKKLASDADGTGGINIFDATEILGLIADANKLPAAANK